ncbi:hypothetical protein H6F67_15550 [Microcoleus sp. FACHB-1515]|uniref:YaaW family protein n=1 Tax=Cyanophyceae TaxID=3028117 RepID=UPI00168974D5|nr:hypothetical protein [Microcoleus sp. FACHB-1515]MBD2091270.1 hypothetical protein [Microcoleus sp. FACHB-1515]
MDELRTGLELANEEELQALTDILFCRKFNPLDYMCAPEPIAVQSQDRKLWLDALEQRFRFLAADGFTVLRGQTRQVSYRQILIQVCRHLKIQYSDRLATEDLEAEVFLHLLGYVWKRLPKAEQQALTARVQRSIAQMPADKRLTPALQQDPLKLILKGGSAIAVTSVVRPWVLSQIARQFAIHAATYEVAKQAAVQGSGAIAAQIQGQVAVKMATRGMAVNAARYGAVRTAFALLGPALWTWFVADLGWRTIATNYGRVIPVVFTLAQIRLTRSECFEPA